MARRRKMDPERKAFISSLLEHYQPKDAQDIQDMLKKKKSRRKADTFPRAYEAAALRKIRAAVFFVYPKPTTT